MEKFARYRLVVGDDIFEDFATWEREIGTWDELQERLLLSDARWEKREPDDGYPEVIELMREGIGMTEAMTRVWGDVERFGESWWSWRAAEQRMQDVERKMKRLFVAANRIPPRRQEWLWTLRVPLNEVTLVAGVQGRGKSMFDARLISGVTRGEFGREPTDVVLLSAEEDPATTIVPRLMAVDADLERVHIHQIEKGFTLPRDVNLLREAIELWDVGLIVIDPLLSYLDDDTDAYSPKEVRRALHALNVLKSRATIVGVIHFRKESAGEVIHMITSSSAFSEVPRSVLGLGREPETGDQDGRVVLVHLKSNVGKQQRALRMHVEESWIEDPEGGPPIESARMVVDEECDLTSDQVFKPQPGRPSTQRDEAKAFLQQEVNRLGGRVEVVVTKKKWDESGMGSVDTLQRARADLGLTVVPDESGTWWWQEPDWTPHRA